MPLSLQEQVTVTKLEGGENRRLTPLADRSTVEILLAPLKLSVKTVVLVKRTWRTCMD